MARQQKNNAIWSDCAMYKDGQTVLIVRNVQI